MGFQAVKWRVLLLAAAIGVSLVAACVQTRGRTADGACGELVHWRLPSQLAVHPVPDDSRDPSVLRTQARINLLKHAAEAQCRLAGGVYPSTLQDLAEPPREVRSQVGACVADTALIRDAWDAILRYRLSTVGEVEIVSSGPDGTFGTRDDISLPNYESPYRESFEIAKECRTEVSRGR